MDTFLVSSLPIETLTKTMEKAFMNASTGAASGLPQFGSCQPVRKLMIDIAMGKRAPEFQPAAQP